MVMIIMPAIIKRKAFHPFPSLFWVAVVHQMCCYFILFPSLTLMYGVGLGVGGGADPYSLSTSLNVKNISSDSGDTNEHGVVHVR